jgi:hypothetical protein
MNAQLRTPQRRTLRSDQILLISLVVAVFPRLSGAQVSNQKYEASPAVLAPVPTRTTTPIIGLQDTLRTLDPLRVIRPGRPTEAAAERAKKVQQEIERVAQSIDYSGPRFGITYLPKAAVDSLKNHNIAVGSTITQFGWQLEREIHISPDGPRILNEWVFLAGGLESGVFLPSLTWLVGARDRSGNEIGVGPNASVAGVGLAAAAGVTVHDGGVNFPMNVAVAKSKTGMRVSFLTGFTIH